MPKTTVNEYHCSSAREYEIWFARHIASAQSKTITEAMSESPDGQFRGGIAALNGCHILAPLWGR